MNEIASSYRRVGSRPRTNDYSRAIDPLSVCEPSSAVLPYGTMADRFDEATGKLAKLGVAQVPVLGFVVEAVAGFLPPGADERLKAAVEADISDSVGRLEQRVRE